MSANFLSKDNQAPFFPIDLRDVVVAGGLSAIDRPVFMQSRHVEKNERQHEGERVTGRRSRKLPYAIGNGSKAPEIPLCE